MHRTLLLAPLTLAIFATSCAHDARPPSRAPVSRPGVLTRRTTGVDRPLDETRRPYDLGPEELPDSAVERALAAVIAEGKRAPRDPFASAPWNGKTAPKYLDRVIERYGMTKTERGMLEKNGMVVLSRVSFPSYGEAMHEVHRQELPLFVSADAILEAVFRSHEHVLLAADTSVSGRLSKVLEKLHDAIEAESKLATRRYDPSVAKDADLFVGVARMLLDGTEQSKLGQQSAISELAGKAIAAERVESIDLFGRSRMVDFTFYQPRGLYTDATALHGYFRAMVWLTRMEMNLVSRGSRSSAPSLTIEETPREATLALVLADLVERAGVEKDVARIDAYQRALAGPREDVPLAELAKITKQSHISLSDPAAAQRATSAAIGNRYVRTVNYQVMPFGTSEGSLPAIATFFGVSVTADTKALRMLVPSAMPAHVPRGPELAYLMGADAGLRFVDPTGSPLALQGARRELAAHLGGSDLHTAWTKLVLGATEVPRGEVPSFVKTSAAADRRIATGIAGYAQIHHAHVLHTAQLYDFSGCEIPDAYVEPVTASLDATVAYAHKLAAFADLTASAEPASAADEQDPIDDVRKGAARLAETTTALALIARDELAGRPLAASQLAFLRMVAEYVAPGRGYDSSTPGRFNGWYPRMHAEREDAFAKVPFSIDHFTSTRLRQIAFVGEARPALGVFVVDTGGEPRVMVGPVTRSYDRVRPLEARRTLEPEVAASDPAINPEVTPAAGYERSFVAPLGSTLALSANGSDDEITATSSVAMTDVTFEIADVHGATLARAFVKRIPASKDGTDPFTVTEKLVPVVAGAKLDDGAHALRVRLANGEVFTSLTQSFPTY